MVISISKAFLVPVMFKAFLLLFLLNKVKSQSDSLHFTSPNFWPDVHDSVAFQGDAKSSSGALQLGKTDQYGKPLPWSAGRAVYNRPFHLWDSKIVGRQRVANFYTNFTILVKTSSDSPADGIAFFLAPQDSNVQDPGGYLGLFSKESATQPSKNQLVAVEFDTWPNHEWPEPAYPHIGIDVNSIVSVRTRTWEKSESFSGSIATGHISYDAISKILTAILSYPDGGDYYLSHVVDLPATLPELVRVGFSAATGETASETHHVLSWHFSSTFQRTRICAKKPQNRFPTWNLLDL